MACIEAESGNRYSVIDNILITLKNKKVMHSGSRLKVDRLKIEIFSLLRSQIADERSCRNSP